jgi:hypothetical protein
LLRLGDLCSAHDMQFCGSFLLGCFHLFGPSLLSGSGNLPCRGIVRVRRSDLCGNHHLSRHDYVCKHANLSDDHVSWFLHLCGLGDLSGLADLLRFSHVCRRADLLYANDARFCHMPGDDDVQCGRFPDLRDPTDVLVLPNLCWIGDLRAHTDLRSGGCDLHRYADL